MFIKTTFNSDLNHILNCVNKCDFGTKCFAKVEHFVLRLIDAFADRERWNSVADQWLVISGLRCHAAGINH